MKYRKRIAALLLAGLLFCAMHTTAYASGVADGTATGTITVEMKFSGEKVTGGTLTLYQIGRLQGSGSGAHFVKTDEGRSFSGSFDKLGDPALAEEAAAYVRENALPPYATADNKDGKVVFTNVPGGVYLVMQTAGSEGFEPLNPFLVSLPVSKNGNFTYDVNAEGKFQLYQSPTPSPSPSPSPKPTPTPKPAPKPNQGTPASGPKLPQTGQLNWPVPVLAVLGLVLITVGWIMRRGKRNGYEK